MSAVTTHHDAHGHEVPYEVQLRSNRLGLWLFCFSEVFLFLALLVARFYLWGNTRPELSQVLGLLTTSILLVSSFFMNRAETAIAHGDRKTFLNGLLITALLGTLFFVGVVVMEWNVFGLELELFGVEWFGHLRPTDGVFGGVFFAMTGMHALHVLSGIVFILIVWANGRKGHFSPERHWGVEACAIYWHYVDVVWVFFYPALYLIGHVA
ncbi:MAG: heme-copper oxidase subunit III [Chloroflexi bacterium]|nr:MAG: heme-copper oxidase subunit III [Chloroflexota bacterium]